MAGDGEAEAAVRLAFVKVHSFCPEEYIVFGPDCTAVGYVRLRNGWFRVAGDFDCDPMWFDRDFTAREPLSEPEEQGLPEHDSDGEFDDTEVRRAYLAVAARKIAEHRGLDLDGFDVMTQSMWGRRIPDDPFGTDAVED